MDGNSTICSGFHILKEQSFNQRQKFINGWYYKANDCGSFLVVTDTIGIEQVKVTANSTDVTVSPGRIWLNVYYR